MRVIAGNYRSRLLSAPRGMKTRPTSDRLRETLFNVIAPRIEGSAFVDLYAAAPGWREKFDWGNYDSAIIDRHLQLNQFLPMLPGWKEVYHDKSTRVFWKDPP